jgi:hypothetical protein
MTIIEQIEATTLIEKHIRRVIGLQNTQASVLLKHYKLAQKRIEARLLTTTRGSFTEAQLKIVLGLIDTALVALERKIIGEIRIGVDMLQDQAIEDLVKEFNYFEKEFRGILQPIPLDIVLESTKKQNYLFNQYKSSIRSYNLQLRSQMEHVMSQSLIEKVNAHVMVHRIMRSFANEQWKVHRIVRTELHNIYNVSKTKGMMIMKKKYASDLKKGLIHPMDERTGEDSKELAKMNPIIDIDKKFVQIYNGKKYVFMVPPNRPNDRAILIPVRKSWLKKNKKIVDKL